MFKRLMSLLLLGTMLLSLLPALPLGAQAAGYTTADWDALRNNWKVSICGDDSVDWSDPEIQKIVGQTNSSGVSSSGISYNGGKYWNDLESNRSNSGRVFGSTNITITVSSDTMRKQFVYLMYMAKAYGTKGTVYTYKDSGGNLVTKNLYQNHDLRNAVFYGLEKSTSFFNRDRWSSQKSSSTSTTYYNWWDWAFGSPDEILQTLLVMYPYKTTTEKNIANEIIDTCRYLIDTIRPNNDGKTDESTISYRRTRLRICGMIAALKQDTALMEQTRTNLVNFLAKNDGGNGVQLDDSYVAHDYFAYEGCYGVQNLAERIIGSYYVMAGTAFELDASNKHNQVDWIIKTFMPAMHNGVMMMQSNGRFPASGREYGRYAITAALQLLGCFEPEDDLQLIQFIRSAVVRDTEEETQKLYSALAVSLGNVMLVQRLKECVFEHNMPEQGGTYAQMRYRNDRAVQHTEDYTVGLAMSSRRIATHESINGANRYGWYIGDGALYVYNDKTSISYDQYGPDFNRYANMYRIPGTTEENSTTRKPVSQRQTYFPGMTYTSSGWTQDKNKDGVDAGAFVGGVDLDGQFVAAAMDFEAYSWSSAESAVEKTKVKNPVERNNLKQVLTSDLTAKKSYFLFDDEIVCVGSDIDFSTRSNSVYTYVDNRELTEKTTVNGVTTYGTEDIIVDGVTLEKVNSFSTKKYTDPAWVYAGNFGGYVFPKGGNITIKKAYRESSADGDNTNDSFNDYTLGATAPNGKHSFFEMWVDHGSKPVNGSYSYVMLPGKTAEETEGYSKSPDITISKNTTSLHVVKENTLGITAMVFWKAGTYGDITVDKPMIVMVRELDGMYTITASDPTQELTTATITINRPLHSWDIHSRMTVSGTSKITIKVNFSGAKGASIASEFSVADTQQLMFDFTKVNSGKYHDKLYGFKNYGDVNNWAPMRIPTDSLSFSGGKLIVPLTTEKNSSGDPQYHTYIQPSDSKTNFVWNSNYTDNAFLNFKASNAEIFQIRLKLEGATAYGSYDPGVYLTYLPEGSNYWSGSTNAANNWKETIKAPIPLECMKGGSLEGKYVTLTFDLSNKKISSCGTIKAVTFMLGYMRGGKATIDHIYIGRKTHSLYFGFGKDGSVPRYAEGAYGGHDFDDAVNPTWATNCTKDVGSYFKLDPVEGTMTLYTGEQYYGTLGAGEHYGAYLATSASSGSYASESSDANLPLSYDPSQAEIVEVRFKTEALAPQEGGTPQLMLVAMQEKNGVVSSDSSAYIPFTITNGQWQTLRIPVGENLKQADYLKSLGLRFKYTRNQKSGEFAKIVVDYIYMGKESEAPSKLYIGFTNKDTDKERYLSQSYGNVNLDTGGWAKSSRIDAPVFSSSGEGTMKLKMTADATQGVFYIQSSPAINRPLCMEYDTKNAEIVQFRLKMKNFKAYDNPRIGVYFYSTVKSHPLGSDTIRNVGTSLYYPTSEELNRDSYITVTFPVSEAVKAAEKITALRLSFIGMESIGTSQLGEITVDYVYVGPSAFAPEKPATVTYMDDSGKVLATEVVFGGSAASYTGPTPEKKATETEHYIFTGWDKDLSKVTEDVTVIARFKAEPHSFTYETLDESTHRGLCPCGYTTDALPHAWDGGTVTTHPDCNSGGVMTYTCTDCKATRTESTAAAGHSYTAEITEPDCTEQGYTTYSCSVCGFSYRDNFLPAKGHTEVTDKALVPTCTAEGMTEGKHCSRCNTVLVAQEPVPATGHRYVYTSLNPYSHRITCKNCDFYEEKSHSFSDGSCICGEKENKEPVEDATLKISHSLNLASDISVNLVVSKSLLAGFDMTTVYMESTVDSYEGNILIGSKTFRIEAVENGGYYYFTLKGLTAVNMNDRIRSVLYGSKEGQSYYSPTDDYSIADYAYSQLNKSNSSDALRRLCADLLRYGAMAQSYKGYRTDAPADGKLTEAQKGYLSDLNAVTFGNINGELNDNPAPEVLWAGKALDLNSKVTLKFVFDVGAYKGEAEALSLVIRYTDYTGKLQERRVSGAEAYGTKEGRYAFSFDGLLAAELRTTLTVQIYEGSTPLSCSLQYSADTYGNNKTGTLLNLCKALFAYADSAKAYFAG